MARNDEYPLPLTVRAALERLTVDLLKELLSLLPDVRAAARKADLVAAIEQELHGSRLRALWEQLDETQKQAVAEAAHSATGVFEPARFRARYGVLPRFGTRKSGYGETPSLLRLFIQRDFRPGGDRGGYVPEDLRQRLKKFVPKPAPLSLAGLEALPEHFVREDKSYEWQEGDRGITIVSRQGVYQAPTRKPRATVSTRQIPLISRETERDALAEVLLVLRRIEQGKLAVSEKTSLPGTAVLREFGGLLSHGDYYPPEARSAEGRDEIGPIKAFGWLLSIQAAGLAELHGRKLALTASGRSALARPGAETLRTLWQRWLKNKRFDEFHRIDRIKGQTGRGKRSMTAPAGRRAVIEAVLRKCPAGQWIEFDRFSRYLQATGHDFEVTREPWDLYVGDPGYGSLGHAGFHDWHILQKRYLACLLFEYAATLGLIDVAYVEPWEAARDYRDLWGTDELGFLSRYDGLLYFRLNPLGAYCLGLADAYRPSRPEARSLLHVLPGLQIQVLSGELSPEEAHFLEAWAERDTETAWRLDRGRILAAVERGQSIAELREFLESRDEQGLPETVEGFLAMTARQAGALRNTGTVLLIECADADLADLIAGNEQTRMLCLRIGPKQLAVKVEAEERFRQALHGLGYGMPVG